MCVCVLCLCVCLCSSADFLCCVRQLSCTFFLSYDM